MIQWRNLLNVESCWLSSVVLWLLLVCNNGVGRGGQWDEVLGSRGRFQPAPWQSHPQTKALPLLARPFLGKWGFQSRKMGFHSRKWGFQSRPALQLFMDGAIKFMERIPGVHSLLSLAPIPPFYWSSRHSTTAHLLKWDRSGADRINLKFHLFCPISSTAVSSPQGWGRTCIQMLGSDDCISLPRALWWQK